MSKAQDRHKQQPCAFVFQTTGGMGIMLVNGESDKSMMALEMHRDKFDSDAEFFAYLHDSSAALERVQTILLEDGYPERVLERCMRMLLAYYDADWCGAINADLEVGIWTPIWWVDAKEGFQAPTLFHEFELPSNYAHWVEALTSNHPVIVEDVEAVKDQDPEEYDNYKRLEVRSVLGVPYYKGSTGFLIIRNPKRYFFQLTPLVMTSYIVAAETNDIRLLLANQNQITSEGIRDPKDVIINMLGGMSISSYHGTIKERDISMEGIGRIIAYLALNPKKEVMSYKLAQDLYPNEEFSKCSNKIRNLIYHFRKDYGILFEQDSRLIKTIGSTFMLDPDLNVTTDCMLFDSLLKEAKAEQDITRKIFILRQAAKLYKGDMLPPIASEHWLMTTAIHYTQKYLQLSIQLCKLLYDQKDYWRCQEQALEALKHIPDSKWHYYWLIRSLEARDMTTLASRMRKNAQQALEQDDYQRLLYGLQEGKKQP